MCVDGWQKGKERKGKKARKEGRKKSATTRTRTTTTTTTTTTATNTIAFGLMFSLIKFGAIILLPLSFFFFLYFRSVERAVVGSRGVGGKICRTKHTGVKRRGRERSASVHHEQKKKIIIRPIGHSLTHSLCSRTFFVCVWSRAINLHFSLSLSLILS